MTESASIKEPDDLYRLEIYNELNRHIEKAMLDAFQLGEEERVVNKQVSIKDTYPKHGVMDGEDNEFVQEDQARIAANAAQALEVSALVHKIATLTQQKKTLDNVIEEAKTELKGLTHKDTDYKVGDSKVSVYTVTRRTFNVPKLKTIINKELFEEVTKVTVDMKMIDKAFETGRITPSDMVNVVTFKDSKAIKVTRSEGETI